MKYQDNAKKVLQLSKNKEMVIGICLGYLDLDDPINDFTPGRVTVDQLANMGWLLIFA